MSLLKERTFSEGRFWNRSPTLRRLFRIADDRPDEWLEEGSVASPCSRPGCAGKRAAASDWRRVPTCNGRELCSFDCLEAVLETQVRRELKQRNLLAGHYEHRMPLGLLMLSRKWITHDQLIEALRRQRREGFGRVGEWLIETGASDEATVARAVAAQWGIAMLSSQEQTPEAIRLLPTLLIEAFGVVPVRVAAGRLFYVAVDDQLDRSLTLAIEKMTSLRVEPVVMARSAFQALQQQALTAEHEPLRLFRSDTVAGILRTLTSIIDETPARSFRLSRVREYFWLRVEREVSQPGAPDRPAAASWEDCILTCPQDM